MTDDGVQLCKRNPHVVSVARVPACRPPAKRQRRHPQAECADDKRVAHALLASWLQQHTAACVLEAIGRATKAVPDAAGFSTLQGTDLVAPSQLLAPTGTFTLARRVAVAVACLEHMPGGVAVAIDRRSVNRMYAQVYAAVGQIHTMPLVACAALHVQRADLQRLVASGTHHVCAVLGPEQGHAALDDAMQPWSTTLASAFTRDLRSVMHNAQIRGRPGNDAAIRFVGCTGICLAQSELHLVLCMLLFWPPTACVNRGPCPGTPAPVTRLLATLGSPSQ